MKITKRERGILIITVTAIVLGINYFLVVPLLGSWKETGEQLKTKQRILDGMRATIQQKDGWSKEYDCAQKRAWTTDRALQVRLRCREEDPADRNEFGRSGQCDPPTDGRRQRRLSSDAGAVHRRGDHRVACEISFCAANGRRFMSVEQLTLAPRPENPSILRCEVQVRALSAKTGRTNS